MQLVMKNVLAVVSGVMLTFVTTSEAMPAYVSNIGSWLRPREKAAVEFAPALLEKRGYDFPPGLCRRETVIINNDVGGLRYLKIQMGGNRAPRPLIEASTVGFAEPYNWLKGAYSGAQQWWQPEDTGPQCQPDECLVLLATFCTYTIKNIYHDCPDRSDSMPFILQSPCPTDKENGWRCLPQSQCKFPGKQWWQDEETTP